MKYKFNQETAGLLDQQDPFVIAEFRSRFVITDPDLIYMDGNSLGRLPIAAAERVQTVVNEEWGTDLIRGCEQGLVGSASAYRR